MGLNGGELDALLPHRAPLQLLSGVREAAEGRCLAWLEVDPEAWYIQPDGTLPAWFGIELMAQTIAAYSGSTKAAEGLPPRLGFLLGTQSFESTLPSYPPGAILEIEARVCFQDESGLCAFDCAIRLEGEVVARSVLKVFEQP